MSISYLDKVGLTTTGVLQNNESRWIISDKICLFVLGDLTIGSSPSCGVVLNGSGVLPVHCTLYRDDSDGILLVPEPEGRTLVDGNRVIEEVNLRQGAMLTIGKANYLRFNNPTEAELIRSTIGSSERISMPQIDFTSNDSSPCEGMYSWNSIGFG